MPRFLLPADFAYTVAHYPSQAVVLVPRANINDFSNHYGVQARNLLAEVLKDMSNQDIKPAERDALVRLLESITTNMQNNDVAPLVIRAAVDLNLSSVYSSAIRAAMNPPPKNGVSSIYGQSTNRATSLSNHDMLETIFNLIKDSAEKDPEKPIDWDKWQVSLRAPAVRLIVLIM